MKRNLTDRTIKSLKPVKAAFEVMDSHVPGFGVRVMPSGAKSFILLRRFPGGTNPTRRSLGACGELTLAEAREKARAWLKMIGKGVDPAVETERLRKEAIDAERAKQAATFGAALEGYLRRKAAKLRSGKAIERELRRTFQNWMERPLADIHRRDVEEAIKKIAKDTPTQAHFVFGMLRTFFNWLIDDGQLETSPCSRIKPLVLIGTRNVRDRTLNDYEIRALWKAARELGGAFGMFVRLLLLAAVRPVEASQARWSEFNLTSRIWEIPAARMKNAAPFIVPLTDDILLLLEELPRFTSGNYLFSTTTGRRPISGFSKAKTQLDTLMLAHLEREGREFVPFVFHDLRRTVRTRLSGLPIEERVRELLLSHSQLGLHRV